MTPDTPSQQSAAHDLSAKAKWPLHSRVTTYGDRDEGYEPITGEIIRLHQTGDGPISYTLKEDTGKEWRVWDDEIQGGNRP